MRADSRKMVDASLTKPSRTSVAHEGELQLRELWRSIVRRHIVVWVDNFRHTQFRDLLMKTDVCLDITAIVVLHTTPILIFLGHRSLQDLVDWVDEVAMGVVEQQREILKVYIHLCPP